MNICIHRTSLICSLVQVWFAASHLQFLPQISLWKRFPYFNIIAKKTVGDRLGPIYVWLHNLSSRLCCLLSRFGSKCVSPRRVPSSPPIYISVSLVLSVFVHSISVDSVSSSLYLFSSPLPICSVQQTDFTCIYTGVNIPISWFSATNRLDIKILPDYRTPGVPKRCANKIF